MTKLISFCNKQPACIAFSPHYKQMAKNTKKLYPEILFFGVSCDHHEDVCDAYGVEGYPTIRFFKAGDDSTSKGIEKEFEAEDARDEDTPEVIASLLNVKSRAGTSLQLPKGESGDNSGSDSSDEPENSKKSGLTNQLSRQRPGLNGFQTGLTRDERSQKYNSFFKTAREQQIQKRQGFGTKLRWKNNKGGQQGPSVVSFNDWTKGMKQNTPGTPEFLNRKQAFQKRVKKVRPEKLKLRPQQQDAEDGNKLPFSKDVRKPKWYQPKKLSPEEELIMDTTLSLVVSLETGLSMGITDITSKSAMKDWLNLLSASLPPEWNVHKLIKRIKANFDYATQSKENFKEIVGTYKLTREGWSPSCKNEALNSAGFTCGFWKLIHVITLGVAEERGGQNLIDSGDFAPTTKVFSPASAAITIRNYIDKFFTCKPCREHFLETFDECENNRRCERLTSDQTTDNPSDWKELAMYFWEFHNDVSVRLVGERIRNTYTHGVRNEPSARDEVAALFPSINDCISCFDDDGAWIKSEVFGFLERAYWPDSEKDPLTDKLLKFEGESDSRLWFLLVAMALTVGLILVLVHRVTGKQSYLIHQSLVTARQLVSTKLRTV